MYTFRKLSDGSLTKEQALALAKTGRDDHGVFTQIVTETIAEADDYDGDLLVHDGDLLVQGDLNVATTFGAHTLFVLGNLTVTGCYSDSDDPQTVTQVTGNLTAGAVVTAGFLEVHGDVTVAGPLLGDYNDCSAFVGGSVRCELFYPEEHHFTIKGDLFATSPIGRNVIHRTIAKSKPTPIAENDPRMLEIFDEEFFEIDSDGDIDHLRDYGAVKKRVRAGLPLKTIS
ncbi:MAG: hypothetical protein KBG15_06200 [Kofleriaceae bacterium]|nr:hypothetical protein [Kofleriaceae bacterium]